MFLAQIPIFSEFFSDTFKYKTIMMEAYKFETTVLRNGIIQLPEISKFANCRIEVFIVVNQPNEQTDTPKKKTTSEASPQTNEPQSCASKEPLELDHLQSRSGNKQIHQFLDKWTGFLKRADSDDSKHQHLTGKYK
uniref:Uncharacterized protein n=1 Tax=Candidatus Kentrum sp. LPFa TaxID=2126335 RepID=A0A450XPX1_9GAMM|nr:MAG: hypothetical protein BECKLPF1236A_GA0070988_101356 [Candidatus Kentron sp. LPFa]VFK31249.1 MAG: hypothetical protein BECKLPF1236C_GA0070990_101326 [Candidatus Kentron sp. LPFa]